MKLEEEETKEKFSYIKCIRSQTQKVGFQTVFSLGFIAALLML